VYVLVCSASFSSCFHGRSFRAHEADARRAPGASVHVLMSLVNRLMTISERQAGVAEEGEGPVRLSPDAPEAAVRRVPQPGEVGGADRSARGRRRLDAGRPDGS
jgi:hypothetical protein